MDKQRVRKYKMRKRALTKRIYSSICLLLVCVLLVTATTYAWLILSRAPEVTDITATIGANGNLEMALTTTEHLTALKANDMYDDKDAGFEFTNGDLLHDNVLWGNLVDLNSSDYGLSTLHMRPAILNVLNGYVADAPISMVTYGSDGRAEDLSLDPTNPNIDTLGFSGVYNVNKGGYYAGSVAMSMDDLQSGNYDKEALIQSVLDSRDYGVRIAGPLDFAGSVNQDQTQANIDLMVDGYCFAIDLLFRTNATEANLLLQTDGIQRVDDEDYEYILDFSGNGSYVEIPNKKLCTAMRVVFADTVTGEVYALAQPDLQGKLWMTARFDENGNPVAVKPGDAAVIKPLVENQVSAVTAWVFLDGTQVDNSYAATVTNVAMKMNLQFATDMGLTPGHPDGNGTNGPPQLAYVGDIYTFGKYEQDNTIENGREPIEWQVLAVDKSKALLVSKYALDTMRYHNTDRITTWENSTIRQWLNSTFVDWAFTAEEQEALVNTTMNPQAERDERIYDKMFLLSDSEVNIYFTADADRVANTTPYAAAGSSDATDWWTRGVLNGNNEGVYVVSPNGALSALPVDTNTAGVRIRPAMWINLSVSENLPEAEATPDPKPGTVSNPRFELVENGIALTFDYPKYYTHEHSSIRYPITLVDSAMNKEYHRSTGSNRAVFSGIASPSAGTYDTISIDTVTMQETTATADFNNLELVVSEEENLSDALYFRLYANSAFDYDFTLLGLTPNTPFLMYTASERNALGTSAGPEYNQIISGIADANGYYYGNLNADRSIINLKDNPNDETAEPSMMYFKVVELIDYAVSADGKNASYTMSNLNNWTLYTPGGIGDDSTVASGKDGDLDWVFTPDGTLHIGGSGRMKDYTYNSLAPWCNQYITKVIIEDGITSIGDCAFYDCDSLTSVTIPDSVTTIGYSAFYHCDSLTSVTIPDSVTTIGGYAFSGCDSLTSVTIPDSVTTIGYSAFSDCDSLTSVTIPNSVTTIGVYAFSNCDSLTSIQVDENNPNYCDIDGVLFNKSKTTLVQYPGGRHGAYAIPDSVTAIGNSAFSYCSSLTSVTIPDSVTTIGDSAFSYCSSLTSVTIGDSVTSIENWAFSYCSSLTSVTIGDSVTIIGEFAFSYCDSLTDVYFEGSRTQWEAISIGNYNYCLTDATIHFAVTD